MNKQIYSLVLILVSGMWFSLPAAASEKYNHTRYQVSEHRDYDRGNRRHERRHFIKHDNARHWTHNGFRKNRLDRHHEDRRSRHSQKYCERHHDEGVNIGIYYEGYL